MNDELRELLYRSLDTELTASEAETLARALAESAELRAALDVIASMRAVVSRSAAQSFSLGFTDRVAAQIWPVTSIAVQAESLQESIRRIFRVVAIAAAPVCIALAIWNLQANGNGAQSATTADELAAVWETPLQSILGDSQ